ncbi:MAG TPA: hypothetical protein VEX38_03095 [Fimbriimonadaceae bacterium]|nr:hypothetical protein [Fimbriimonadaceae bacterium]
MQLPASYVAEISDREYKDAMLRMIRRNWYLWVVHCARSGFGYAGVGALTFYAAYDLSGAFGIEYGMLIAAAVPFAFGFFSPLLGISTSYGRWSPPLSSQPRYYDCELTEEGWGFKTPNGVARFIPWKSMRLEYEFPNMWSVKYGPLEEDHVVVYREPLRRAGLEEEFRSRLTNIDRVSKGVHQES